MDNYKYDGLITRAKITEMISKVQCEVAKQQNFCYHDKKIMEKDGYPTEKGSKTVEKLSILGGIYRGILPCFLKS